MKYTHYDKTTGEILGWYDADIHESVPTPNKEVTDAMWQQALDREYNYINVDTTALSKKDFRTAEEQEEQRKQTIVIASEEYLKSTDWYVTRFIETGVIIPDDVSSLRAGARLRIGDNR